MKAKPPASSSLIERRSIDFIPESERHGRVFSQFTLWLAANLQITAVVTGALAVALGGDIVWSIAGLLLGQIAGGAVMALHGAQGPGWACRRCWPAARSSASRARCCRWRWLASCTWASTPPAWCCPVRRWPAVQDKRRRGSLLFALAVLLAAALGYRAIHRLGRVASLLGLLAFCYLFMRLLGRVDLLPLLAEHARFEPAAFVTAISLSASWQIAFAPYVSDYSRYLPSATPPARVAWAIGLGSTLGRRSRCRWACWWRPSAARPSAGTRSPISSAWAPTAPSPPRCSSAWLSARSRFPRSTLTAASCARAASPRRSARARRRWGRAGAG
ncbi:NCS1 nucleoside transporter family [Chromobacterium violaceum]|uniref:NCS1 nucleoside transporter family n=1 Tax=Chromobacterium violaceum TaxID=536 RepID=A0A447TEF0_CHRVL|nr:NCS1 nucleoside transporter family [Chromobacterium violaceum]